MLKNCVICGNEFWAIRTAITCSKSCSRARRNNLSAARMRIYRAVNRDSAREYQKHYCRKWRARNQGKANLANGRHYERNREKIAITSRNRSRLHAAAYWLLAEMLGGKDNLNHLLRERSLI